MKPATALPWEVKTGRANDLPGSPIDAELRALNGRYVVARLGHIYHPGQKQDADYLAHAANAYPQLVAALDAIMDSSDDAGCTPDLSVVSRDTLTAARDLLAKLGEAQS